MVPWYLLVWKQIKKCYIPQMDCCGATTPLCVPGKCGSASNEQRSWHQGTYFFSGGNTATHQRNTGLEAMVPFPAWKNPDCRFATTPRVQGNCGTASNKQRPVMTKLEYSQNLIFKYLSTVLNMKWYYLLTKKNTYWCVHKRTSFNTGVQKINC